jgi:hypothetical protein
MAATPPARGDKSIVCGWIVILIATVSLGTAELWKLESRRGASRGDTASTAAPSPFINWNQQGAIVDGNAGLAPDGSGAATKLVESAFVGTHYIAARITIDSSRPVVASIYAHAGEGRRLLFYLAEGGDFVARCDVDLATGQATLGTDDTDEAAKCTSTAAKDGWWRVEIRGRFRPEFDTRERTVAIASTAKPFGRAYEGTREGHILIWNVAVSQADAPAAGVSADPSPFGAWAAIGATVSGAAGDAPDGTRAATALTEEAGSGAHHITATINSIDPTKPVGASLYAHSGEGRRLLFYFANGEDFVARCDVDLATGQAIMKTGDADPSASCSSTADKADWWRITMKASFDPASHKGDKLMGVAPTLQPFAAEYEADEKGRILIWNAGVGQ